MRSRVFKITGLTASLVALFVLMGGHWLALQSVAWTRMIADFAQTESLGQALTKTFDGDHPCKLCLNIREGRQQEQREQREAPLIKGENSRDLFSDQYRVNLPDAPANAREAVGHVPQLRADFQDSPPSPPPRLNAVL